MLADGVELEAIAAPPQQLTEEELRAARDAEWRAEQDTLIEQRKRLFNKLPKRGQLGRRERSELLRRSGAGEAC